MCISCSIFGSGIQSVCTSIFKLKMLIFVSSLLWATPRSFMLSFAFASESKTVFYGNSKKVPSLHKTIEHTELVLVWLLAWCLFVCHYHFPAFANVWPFSSFLKKRGIQFQLNAIANHVYVLRNSNENNEHQSAMNCCCCCFWRCSTKCSLALKHFTKLIITFPQVHSFAAYSLLFTLNKKKR